MMIPNKHWFIKWLFLFYFFTVFEITEESGPDSEISFSDVSVHRLGIPAHRQGTPGSWAPSGGCTLAVHLALAESQWWPSLQPVR